MPDYKSYGGITRKDPEINRLNAKANPPTTKAERNRPNAQKRNEQENE